MASGVYVNNNNNQCLCVPGFANIAKLSVDHEDEEIFKPHQRSEHAQVVIYSQTTAPTHIVGAHR